VKTLLLHIGVHKTGSTAIQHLLAHAEPFGDRVLYPRSGRPERADRNGHHGLLGAIRRKPGHPEGCWDQLFRELEQTSAEVVVLSAEGFSSCRDDEVESLRHRLCGLDVRVLVYLRNPLDFMASSFAQAVKSGGYPARFRDFIRLDERIARCNYAALMDRWVGAWGRERVQLRIYDKVATSLLEDFLAQVPVPHVPIGDLRRRNITPPVHVIDLLRYVNRLERLGGRVGVPAELFSRVRRSLREKRGLGGPVRALHKRASRRSRVYSRRDVEYLRGAVEEWMEDFLGRYVAAEDRHYFAF
jgi:hypothetical protein